MKLPIVTSDKTTHRPQSPPASAAFETVPWSDRDGQNRARNQPVTSAWARRAAIPLGFGDYVLNCTRSGTGAKQVIRCADLFHRSHIDWAESLGVHACNDVSKPALHLASR